MWISYFFIQVVLQIPGQQTLIPASSTNGQQPLVTYLQPLGLQGSVMEQGQVLMAASDMQGNLTLHNVPTMNTNTKRNREYFQPSFVVVPQMMRSLLVKGIPNPLNFFLS